MPGARVLVVDDDEPTVRLTTLILNAAGYEVVAETDPAAAYERAEAGEQFDLAVLDVVMPVMSGEALSARLRKLNPDLKVLYVTGFDDALFQARPVLWQGESFLEKPVTVDSLREAVAMAIYGRTSAPASSQRPASSTDAKTPI